MAEHSTGDHDHYTVIDGAIIGAPIRTQLVTEDACIAAGGHCFERTGITLTSNPPQYPEVCKHCGKRRVAMPQAPFTYREA